MGKAKIKIKSLKLLLNIEFTILELATRTLRLITRVVDRIRNFSKEIFR